MNSLVLLKFATNKMIFLFLSFLIVSETGSQEVLNPTHNLAFDFNLYENVLDPELCRAQLQEMRAFEFYDASFRIPQSIFKGGTFSFGNYHQCLGISQALEESTVRGKYCLIQTESLNFPILTGTSWPGNVTWITLNTDKSEENRRAYEVAKQTIAALGGEDRVLDGILIANAIPMTLAVCVPRPCRVEDVFSPLMDITDVDFNYTNVMCRLPDDKPYSAADKAAVVIFSVLGCLILLSSAYELHHIFIKKETSKPNEILSCFSVYSNTNKLMTISSRPGMLDCLDGIRSLSILWVITGHTFIAHLYIYLLNGLDANEWISHLKSIWIRGANVSVDSFLTLSGLLLVYTSAKKMKQMQLVKSLHLFYLNRLLRMFPLLAAAVLLQASVLHHVSDGVRWDHIALETQRCRDYWWSTLLHVQNLVNPRDICLPHTWYLSVDVQLHILSPLLLFWVLGSRRTAWTGLTAGLLAALTATIVYCFVKQFSGLHDEYYVVYFYHNTMTRSPAFIIGMIFGYMLHISRGRQVKIPAWLVITAYVLAAATSWYCLYQRHPDWDARLWINLNTALVRSGWSVSLCWLIYACVNGYSGPINWFLSLKLWKFTARISYAMYIFHYPMQFVMNAANIMPAYFSMESIFLLLASDIAYSAVVSVAASVLIDTPFSTLQRRLMAAIAPARPDKPAMTTEAPTMTQVESNEKSKPNGQEKQR